MGKFERGYRIFGWVKLAGAIVSGISIFLMMCFITYDVFGRNFLGSSVRGGFEIVENYFMPVAIFPALGYAYASGILPKMDMVVARIPVRLRGVLTYVLLAVELVIFLLLAYFTWGYATSGYERGTAFPAAGTLYPVWPLYFLVPFGVALVLVETLFVVARNVTGRGATLSVGEAS